jgi:transcriptional regulator GlxA family with amidase domain
LDARRREHYQRIVARFEGVARANLGTSMRIADLCRAFGVTPRTLERAVRAIHATTPVEFLHALRLTEARQTLLSKCGAAGSVTEVATRFGFRELGRFAAEYRQRFGESPSETLRRNCQGE